MIRVLGLQRADQKFELRKASQTRKAGIFQEVRPAGKSRADASLQPLKGSFAPSGQGQRGGDLIIRMMRMPEGFWTRTGAGHTLDCRVLIPPQRVQQTL